MSWLDLYYRLPYPGRCLAASLRGFSLDRWRYGAATPRLVEEALERESWNGFEWQDYQSEALAAQLVRATEHVPFYRRLWRGRTGDPRRLADWPVLDKESLRRDPRAFLTDGSNPRRMLLEPTSGSTGTPLTLWRSRWTSIAWYALVEARMRRWNGVARGDRWAVLGGQLVVPASARRPPYWVWNVASRQLYLSSYHLAPETAADYLGAVERSKASYLLGYASALSSLARLAEEEGLTAPRLRVVLSNAEPLYAHQREVIERVFGCPVRDTYGTAELAGAASECKAGNLHLWSEVAVTEVLDDDGNPVAPGLPGRLVATTLLNGDMPLVRYEVGDRLALAPPDWRCSCGCRLPLVASIEGRLDDLVVTPEGRRIGRLDPVFKGDVPIREAQIVQETRTRVEMLVVPAPGYSPRTRAELGARLAARLGPSMEVEVREVEHLERGRSGKLRTVVSKLPREEVRS